MLILITGTAMSQTNAKPIPNRDSRGVYSSADVMPSFPGGDDALMKYLKKNLKYPVAAKTSNIQGKVFVAFVVNADGKVTDVTLLKKDKVGGGCDEEAIRIIQAMPAWTPGKLDGKNIPVQLNLPVQFKLDNGELLPDKSKK